MKLFRNEFYFKQSYLSASCNPDYVFLQTSESKASNDMKQYTSSRVEKRKLTLSSKCFIFHVSDTRPSGALYHLQMIPKDNIVIGASTREKRRR